MFSKNFEFSNVDHGVTEKKERPENKHERLNIHTDLAIKIHDLYYKRLLSKDETKAILRFLKKENYGKDNYNTLEVLHLMKKNDYTLANQIVTLANSFSSKIDTKGKDDFLMTQRDIEDIEYYGTNTNEFIQEVRELGFEQKVIEKWIEEGQQFSTAMNGRENIHRLPTNMIDEDVITFVKHEYQKHLNARELQNIFDTMPEAQKSIVANMHTDSAGDQNAMTLDKIDMAKDIITSTSQHETPPNNLQTVYYGSSSDVELPMLAKLQNIKLVDPELTSEKITDTIKRVRETYATDAIYNEEENLLTFTYDDKNFSIQFFGTNMEDFNENTDQKFDIALTFNKVPWMTKKELTKQLQKDGILFDNRDIYDEDGPDFSKIPPASQFA